MMEERVAAGTDRVSQGCTRNSWAGDQCSLGDSLDAYVRAQYQNWYDRSRIMPSFTSWSAFGVIMSGLCHPTLCQPRSSTMTCKNRKGAGCQRRHHTRIVTGAPLHRARPEVRVHGRRRA